MAIHIGIDFGTRNIEICQKDKGIVLREPTTAAVDTRGNVAAVGTEALLLRGRAPGTVTIRRPLDSTGITDFNLTAEILDKCLEIAAPRTRKHVTVAVKYGFGGRSRELLKKALSDCRTGSIKLCDSAVAAMGGCGIIPEADEAEALGGTVICDIGASSVEASYIRSGELLRAETVIGGGDAADASVCSHMRMKYGLSLSPSEAREIKHKLSLYECDVTEVTLSGLDTSTGMPKRVTVGSLELLECCTAQIDDAAELIKRLLSNLPRQGEKVSHADAIILIGGGALLPGIAEYITALINRPVIIPDSPIDCVARGLEAMLG